MMTEARDHVLAFAAISNGIGKRGYQWRSRERQRSKTEDGLLSSGESLVVVKGSEN